MWKVSDRKNDVCGNFANVTSPIFGSFRHDWPAIDQRRSAYGTVARMRSFTSAFIDCRQLNLSNYHQLPKEILAFYT